MAKGVKSLDVIFGLVALLSDLNFQASCRGRKVGGEGHRASRRHPWDKPKDEVSVIGSICDSIKGMILFRVRGVAVRPKT